MNLDFSGFHDLMHRPFTAHCRTLPGGGFRHLRLLWIYRWHDRLLWPYLRVKCWLGLHQIWVGYTRHISTGQVFVTPHCDTCGYERLPSEAEIDAAKDIPWQF